MSPWASASQTTLRGEQHGPERPHERETSPQEVVAWLRHDMVKHLKRAEPYGDTSPWHTLSAMPASHARNWWSETRVGARAMFCSAQALQVNLLSPGGRLGSRRARMGQPVTRHLHHAVGVCHDEHGKLPEGCEGEWDGGKGDPNETPMPQDVADGA